VFASESLDSKKRSVCRLRQHNSASIAIAVGEYLLCSAIWCSRRRYEARLIEVCPLKQLQRATIISAQILLAGITNHLHKTGSSQLVADEAD